MNLELVVTKRTDYHLIERMSHHYSRPKGFVGRNICYAILYDNEYYGHIVGGSATRFLPDRNDYLGTTIDDLNGIVNNIFFNVQPIHDKYPRRNFTSFVINEFTKTIQQDWENKYCDCILGFETLIEKPRTGECYRRAGWHLIGETKGYTCKRTCGKGTDNWTGKRVWNTSNLKPKLVFAQKVDNAIP